MTRSEETSEIALTVRVPKRALDRIDALVEARPTKIPRHSWLLEAIYEKLYKEDHVEGVLDILWENAEESRAPSYRLEFVRPDRRKGEPVAPMAVVGDDSLERYLVEWGFTSEHAKGWIQKLKTDHSVSIPNVMMPGERVGPYGFRVGGLGIRRKLRDGRLAILFPNHWRGATDESVRGSDKIMIFSSTGFQEKEATVTRTKKVLILTALDLMSHPDGRGSASFREASEKEAAEFLDIHRQYIPD